MAYYVRIACLRLAPAPLISIPNLSDGQRPSSRILTSHPYSPVTPAHVYVVEDLYVSERIPNLFLYLYRKLPLYRKRLFGSYQSR